MGRYPDSNQINQFRNYTQEFLTDMQKAKTILEIIDAAFHDRMINDECQQTLALCYDLHHHFEKLDHYLLTALPTEPYPQNDASIIR